MTDMVESTISQNRSSGSLRQWLLKGHIEEVEGPHEREKRHHKHPWWQVMCLTGVDYFSHLDISQA
jgi:hypothetical protein